MEVEKYKMIYSKSKSLDDLTKGLIKYQEDYEKFENTKILREIMNDDIRILGEYFVKRNINKAKIIIKNKKYKLKEYINSKKFLDDKIKINMIFSKDLTNISHMFENCPNLKEFSIHDNMINITEEESENIYKYDNYNNDTQNKFYENLKIDNIYSIYSEITDKKNMYDNPDTSTFNYFMNNIKITRNDYLYD